MARKVETLPHYGVRNGYTRKQQVVCTKPETKSEDGRVIPATFRDFGTISKAKKFMRIGE